MTYDVTESGVDYAATRVQLKTNAHFTSFVAAFERAVPELTDRDAVARFAEDGDWSGFVRGLQWEASSGFVRVQSFRPDGLMRFAGSTTASAVWLVVNHGIAARLFRQDPATALYSPLRIEAHASRDAGTTIGFDLPSAALKSFGINKLTQAGAELDRALGDLFEDLGMPRPSVLRR